MIGFGFRVPGFEFDSVSRCARSGEWIFILKDVVSTFSPVEGIPSPGSDESSCRRNNEIKLSFSGNQKRE